MSVYLILSINVVDKERFAPYGKMVTPVILRHQGAVLTADFNGKVLEGSSHQANVILRFPSREHADPFYNGPEYGPMKQLRIDTTAEGTVSMVNEFVHPA